MLRLDISGWGELKLEHLVLDYNGTIAEDGVLVPGVAERIRTLAEKMTVHVLTADTHGGCRENLAGLPVRITVLESAPEDEAKAEAVERLGPDRTACLGNGQNDRLMLQKAALGVAVLGPEALAVGTLVAADLVVADALAGLDLFLKPRRLTATLRT